MVEWFEKLDMPLVCDLLERWPRLEELQKVSGEELRMFFRQHYCHRKLMERRILAIGRAIPAIRDRAVNRGQECGGESDRAIDPRLAPRHCRARREDRRSGRGASGFFHFRLVAGSGCGVGAAPVGRLGSQRDRYRYADDVQTYSGIAPVMERSGKHKWGHFRWACSKFVRQSFHEWAGHSIAQSVWAPGRLSEFVMGIDANTAGTTQRVVTHALKPNGSDCG